MQYLYDFDDWYQNSACEHPGGKAIAHYIGNIALVAYLREELGKSPELFSLILEKVIYNGTHCGDDIPIDEVAKMQVEVINLSTVHSDDPKAERFLRHFEKQMTELVECSLRLNRPIVF